MNSSNKKIFIISADTKTGHHTVTSEEIALSANIEYFLNKNEIPFVIYDIHTGGRFIEYKLPGGILLQNDTWCGTCDFFNSLTGERLHYRECN